MKAKEDRMAKREEGTVGGMEQDKAKRIEYFGWIRETMKERGLTVTEMASCEGKSTSWIHIILRGDYPSTGAYCLPVHLQEFFITRLQVPSLSAYLRGETKPPANPDEAQGQGDLITPKQISYLRRLCNEQGINATEASLKEFNLIPERLNRKAASRLIDMVKPAMAY
jgi:transcriptional regulator with XRE-family HTH domain